MVDDRLGVLLGEFLKLAIPRDRLRNGGGLVARDVAGKILTLFPGLKFVVGALWAFAHDGKFATFHALDLGDLLKPPSRLGNVHGHNIYQARYNVTRKTGIQRFLRIPVLHPTR